MTTTALIIDTEVSSLETKEVVELAWLGWEPNGDRCTETHCRRFRPSGEWQAGAIAVHGILPQDVEECRPSREAAGVLPESDYVIGHNIDFDCEALGGLPGRRRICTLAIARNLYPKFESHKLAALNLELNGFTEQVVIQNSAAHGAAADVLLCRRVLDAMCGEFHFGGLEDLWKFSEESRIPRTMPFGKHRGERIEDVPASYRRWLLGQSDVDPYLRKALEMVGVQG